MSKKSEKQRRLDLEKFEKQDLITFILKESIFIDAEESLKHIEKWRKHDELNKKIDANMKRQGKLLAEPNPTWETVAAIQRLHKKWSAMFDERCKLTE